MILENRRALWFLIILNLIFYLLYLKFVFVSYYLCLYIVFIALFFYLGFIYLNKKFVWKIKTTVLNSIILIYSISLFLSTLLMSYNLLNRNKIITQEYKVRINGYYVRKVDGVLFDFKGKKCDRPYNLLDKVTKNEAKELNFYKKYFLKLNVKEFCFDMYYIESIELIKPDSADLQSVRTKLSK